MWTLLLFTLSSAIWYPCQFNLPDGNTIDLSSLYTDIPDYEMDAMDVVYRANICGDTHKACGTGQGVATQWFYNGNCIAVLARQEPSAPVATYLDPANPNAGIKLTYSNGDDCEGFGPRKVVYNIHCAKDSTSIALVQEYDVCVYTFEIYSKSICPDKSGASTKSSSSSTGIWILLLGVIGFALYCIIGSVLNRRNNPDLPVTESIPHKAFWEEVPSLVGDGIQFTVGKGKDLISRVTGKDY